MNKPSNDARRERKSFNWFKVLSETEQELAYKFPYETAEEKANEEFLKQWNRERSWEFLNELKEQEDAMWDDMPGPGYTDLDFRYFEDDSFDFRTYNY